MQKPENPGTNGSGVFLIQNILIEYHGVSRSAGGLK